MRKMVKKACGFFLTAALLIGELNITQVKAVVSDQTGRDAASPTTVSLCQQKTFEIASAGGTAYAEFTPLVDSRYGFSAESDKSVKCSLYNSGTADESNPLKSGTGSTASFNYALEAGTTYKIKLAFSSSDSVGTISLLVRASTTSISFQNSSETISVGDTVQLSPVVEPEVARDNELRWRSSNMNVATVSSTGLVTALKEGSATVYAESWDGKKSSLTINVVKPQVSVDASGPSAVLPGEKASFSIDKPEGIAYIDFTPPVSAKYDFRTEGSEAVRCYLYDSATKRELENAEGSAANFNYTLEAGTAYKIRLEFSSSASTGTISLLVRAAASSISFPNSSETISIGDTMQLSPVVEPEAARKNDLQWHSSDTDVATVSSTGLVTAIGVGYAYIYAEGWEGREAEVTVNVIKPQITTDATGPSTVALGEAASFSITKAGGVMYTEFTPPVASTYNFYATSLETSRCSLYSATGKNELDGDSGSVINFSHALEAQTTYRIKLEFSSSDSVGTISLQIRAATSSVSFYNSSETLSAGDTLQLSPVVEPEVAKNNTLSWRSSDTDVATVSSTGLVTAVGEGTAYVYAESWDGREDYVSIKVVEPYVWLQDTYYSLYIGQSFNLMIGSQNVSVTGFRYSTSDSKVATVTSTGKVTALKPGTAKITVEIQAGGHTYTRTCDVHVLNPYLSDSSVTLYKNRTVKLTVYHGSGKATWTSSNPKICTVSNGKVKAKKKGKATITCKINGVSLKCKVTVQNPMISTNTLWVTKGFKGYLYVYRGTNNSRGGKWTSANKKIATVKKGVVVGKKIGKTTIKCRVDGVTVKCKVIVRKNVYKATPMKIHDLTLGSSYCRVVKEYFSGNKLKVKLRIYNTHTDRKMTKIKVLTLSQYAGGRYIRKRIVNKKIKLKAYSSKTYTFTIAKGKNLKKRIDLGSGYTASVIRFYYYYKYTY